MTKPSAAQKRKNRREEKLLEEAAQRAEDDRAWCARPSPVPIPPPVPAASADPTYADLDDPEPYDWHPPLNLPMFDASMLRWHGDDDDDEPIPRSNGPHHAFPPGHLAANWPADTQCMVYGLPPDDDVPPPAPVLVVSSACTAPRDISALRGPAAMHPWRTVRKRNHRLLPQRCERRPFPKSLPRRTVISAPRATVLALHDSPPISVPTLPTPSLDPGRSVQPAHLLGLTPLHPDDPIHPDDVASIDMTAPSLCPCPADHFIGPPISLPPALPPVFPAQTTYGPVRSSLALACAGEKACIDGVSQIFDIVWGPYPSAMLQNYLAELPGDQLVFLCMLAEFAALEPVFDGFLRPAIVDFAKGWVTHCLQQDSHG